MREQCDQYDRSEEHHTVAQDPDLAEHLRLRFLHYPYKDAICSAQDLSNSEEPQITISYNTYRKPEASREPWNSAFQEVVDKGVVTDLILRIHSWETDDVAPDFAILLQCPLKSFSFEKSDERGYYETIPQGIITALGTLRGLEALTLFDVNTSDRLINQLNSDHFPNLRYLSVCLHKEVNFRQLPTLTVLVIDNSGSPVVRVDLRSLTELKALAVSGLKAVVKLGRRSQLKWLNLSLHDIKITGDISGVTHLLLGQEQANYDVVSRCPNLKQLSLCMMIFDRRIAIPASVDRLLISHCQFREIALSSDKTFEVLSLVDVHFLSEVTQTLKATHLRLSANSSQAWTEFGQSLRKVVLGSPKSLCVECEGSPHVNADLLASYLQSLLLEQEDFIRDIQFFATNLQLQNPLPPMPKLRELCLERFADLRHIREIGNLRRIEKLFIAGNEEPLFDNWGELQLQDISDTLIVPARLSIPEHLGLSVTRSNVIPLWPGVYAKFLWADYVQRSSGKLSNFPAWL